LTLAGERSYVNSLLQPRLKNVRSMNFSCSRVVWHNSLANHVAKEALEAGGETELTDVLDVLETEGQEDLAAKVREALQGWGQLRGAVELLEEATRHEYKFGGFASRSYTLAKEMERENAVDEDLEERWDEVVQARAKEERERRRKEARASSARSDKPSGSGASGSRKRAGGSNSGGAGRGSSGGGAGNRAKASGAKNRVAAGPSKERPCHRCGQAGHWRRDCPNPPKPV